MGRYNPAPTAIRKLAAAFWLNYFFWHAERFPRLTLWSKWIYLSFALLCSKTIRLSTAANARRIFGDSITAGQQRAFRNDVVSSFFNFVADVAASIRSSRQQLLGRIRKIHGEEKYLSARAIQRGAIIVTLHMGSFEVAAAAMHLRESNIHVVFKRDLIDRFERLRTRARQNLNVIEAPVDDGWGMWIGLRDALMQNHVVMLQADRVMPGQKGLRMKFLHGHLLMPTGPVRLAMLTGAPIIPIVTTRDSDGQIQIHIEDAIDVLPDASVEESMLKLRDVVEKYVRTYPTQWLMLEPAFCEDQT
jgi:KDO2-lipid IV(A) lauroyltransferase